MLTTEDRNRFATIFQDLCQKAPDLVRMIGEYGTLVSLTPGQFAFGSDQRNSSYVLLVRGLVRVRQVAPDGRAVTLYDVLPGDLCMLSTMCALGDSVYPAQGVALEHSDGVVVPADKFRDAVMASPPAASAVFGNVVSRASCVLRLLGEMAFERVDARVARALIEAMDDGGNVSITHETLALDIGSVREVVSRTLKRFEHEGLVKLGRGHVQVLRPDDLESLSSAHR